MPNKTRHEHFVSGALSNYVSLGEIPDHNVPGTQGHEQHQALLHELKTKGVSNDVPLYRGASRTPAEDAADSERPGFLSFTPDRKVAEHFAKVTSGGKLHVAAPGTVRGLPLNERQFSLPDQAEKHDFKQYPEENEWLVHKDSFSKPEVN
jgi:hypothetical protein